MSPKNTELLFVEILESSLAFYDPVKLFKKFLYTVSQMPESYSVVKSLMLISINFFVAND